MLPLTLLLLPVTVFGHILDTACLTQSPTGNPDDNVGYHGLVAGFDSDGNLSYRRAASTRNYEKYNYPDIGSGTCDDDTQNGNSMESCGYFANVHIIPISLTGENDVTFAGDMVQLTYSSGNKDERKELRFGVFHCIASKENQDVFSTLTIMSNEAVFKPFSFTITANLEDRVTIEMSPYTNINRSDIKWRHTWGDVIEDKEGWAGNTSPVIAKVGLSDAGVYEAYTENSNKELSGYIRLIVRGCRYNLWGSPSCQWTCPVCYNGGVCDDVTGTCICPPGFTGDRCERVCPRGFIGQRCDIDCPFVTGETYCQRVEICLPDPFGCTCAPGYTGLDCNSACANGHYGTGCTQLCHCARGSCDPRSGECDSGTCESTWGGPMCQVKVLDAYGFGFPATVNTIQTSKKSDIEVITTLPVDDNTQLRLGREVYALTGNTGSGVSNKDVNSNIPSSDSGLPTGSLTFNPNLRGGNGLQLRSANDDLESRGIFYAETISYQRREHIAILRMSNQLEDLTVAPNQYTWIVGTSESVTMHVTVYNGKSTTDLVWRHNGNTILGASGKDNFTIQTARKSDEGVYECFLQNEPEGFQAMMLLKVRSCPSGKWGVHCNNTCPVCYYQGICHDETGECVCQAGYTGSDCSQICGRNSNDQMDLFGQSCSLQCGDNNQCRCKQICSPHPIGCHCRAGFDSGVKCHESCSSPNFGPDCSMEAHCDTGNGQYHSVTGCSDNNSCHEGYEGPGCQELKQGQNCPDGFHGKLCDKPCHCANFVTCDRNTGSCDDSMCAEGWGGSNCDNALPYLNKSPVTSVVDNEVRVTWELWRIGNDYGTGPVSVYRINYAQNDETIQARQSVMSTPSFVLVSGYAVELVGLNPLEEYTISVSPIKVIDGVETAGPSSPSTNVTSACGQPNFSPTIQYITSPSEQVLIVGWQITSPPRQWMNCTPSITVFYIDIGGQEQKQEGFGTNENEIKIMGLESCKTYSVSMAVKYQNGKVGVRSDAQTAVVNSTDPTVKPDPPTVQRLNGTNPVELMVSWIPITADLLSLKCDPSTGFFYVVKWQLSSGDMDMYFSNDINEDKSTFTISENLLQCSEYAVTVAVKNAAANVGPDSDDALVRTDSDAPTAVPTDVELERLQGTDPVSLEASWKIQPINLENLKCDPDETDYYFIVYYHPTEDDSSVKFLKVPSNQTDVTITTFLEQCTLYDVYVTVKNVVLRESEQSLPETMRTDSEDPTATPSNLKVDKIPGTTNMRISVSWQIEEINHENLKCDPNNTEYNFQVYYRPKDDVSNTKAVSVPGTSTTMTIEDNELLQCTHYEVYVTLKNVVGRESNQSSVETVLTESEDPTTRLTFDASRLQGTEPVQIQVTWTTDELSKENLKCDPALGYTVIVSYNRHDDTSLGGTEEIVDESTNTAIISGNLDSCTEYDVYLDIRNAAGKETNNMDSAQQVITDSQDVTLQPIFNATSVTETSISLSWELSEEANKQSLKCNYPEHPYNFVVILESPVGNETENVLEESQQTFVFENLTESTSYKVFVMVRNFAGRMGPADTASVTTDATTNPLAIALGVTMPLLLLLLILLFLSYFLILPKRRNKKKAKNYAVGLDFKGYVHDESSKKSDVTTKSSSFPSNGTDREQNTCIPVKELPKHVKAKKISEAGFKGEYEKLLQGNYKPSEVGTTEANKEKNRFKNIVTYDHSRVKLPIINDDPSSDYINASYIHGYKRRNAYIASQGPNKASLEDFWRMIWNERCRKIIMVTNLTESGKVKCMKYWPDVNKIQTYFDMEVATREEKHTHQLVTRRFTITKNTETQEITQFHFIGWPDMKVPQSADVLWDMLDEAEKDETTESPPVVVHCSAGCGRTGTIIALSSLRKMMRAENKVDVFKFVNDMRKQRTTMVQVCDQYQFIFESLLIYSQVGKPSVKVDEYETTLRKWKTSQNSKASSQCQMNKQFNIIKYVSPFPKRSKELAGSLPQNINKNRYPELIPLNRFRPNLMTEVDGKDATNYINASFCDGHNKRDQFLSTQIPLSNTVVDFWRMVYDYECFTIVMFEAETSLNYADYWPSQGREEYYGPFIVTADEQETENDITRRNFRLSMNGKNSSATQKCRVITQYSLQHLKVLSKSAILSLVESVEMHERQHEGKRIVVQCLDGVRESSMFMAIYHCCERIRDDGIVDLFTVVRRLRERRPEMIGTLDQYEFCLDAIKERLATANVYANI